MTRRPWVRSARVWLKSWRRSTRNTRTRSRIYRKGECHTVHGKHIFLLNSGCSIDAMCHGTSGQSRPAYAMSEWIDANRYMKFMPARLWNKIIVDLAWLKWNIMHTVITCHHRMAVLSAVLCHNICQNWWHLYMYTRYSILPLNQQLLLKKGAIASYTVKLVYKDHPWDQRKVVFIHRLHAQDTCYLYV